MALTLLAAFAANAVISVGGERYGPGKVLLILSWLFKKIDTVKGWRDALAINSPDGFRAYLPEHIRRFMDLFFPALRFNLLPDENGVTVPSGPKSEKEIFKSSLFLNIRNAKRRWFAGHYEKIKNGQALKKVLMISPTRGRNIVSEDTVRCGYKTDGGGNRSK